MKAKRNILFEVSLVPESDKDSATHHAVYSSLWLNPGDSIHSYICRKNISIVKNIKRETEFVYAKKSMYFLQQIIIWNWIPQLCFPKY